MRTPRSPFAGDWAADESTPAATWLNAMRALAASGDSQQAVDAIFEKIDGLLDRGAYAECDALVRTIDVDRFGTFELVAFLAATLAAAASLPSRPTLVNAAERRLRELAPDRVERLMSGLHAT